MNKNTNFHVRNLRNTTTRNAQSWIGSESRAIRCSVVGCSGSFEVEAYVTIVEGKTSASYIAPFCKSCSHHTNTEIMVLKASTILVPVTTSCIENQPTLATYKWATPKVILKI
jgi:hypothetical protein